MRRDLLESWWRRRDDGWIGGVHQLERRPGAGGVMREFAQLVWAPDEGPTESELVLPDKIGERFDEVRSVRCRRCKTPEVWRFVGPGERYVSHGCAQARREYLAREALRLAQQQEERASAWSMLHVLRSLIEAKKNGDERALEGLIAGADQLVRNLDLRVKTVAAGIRRRARTRRRARRRRVKRRS